MLEKLSNSSEEITLRRETEKSITSVKSPIMLYPSVYVIIMNSVVVCKDGTVKIHQR